MKLPIYLDNQSTTQTDPRVVESMLPYFTEKFGNAHSRSHVFGWEAEAAVEEARAYIAQLIQAQPKEIIFTSGATESINTALKGAFDMYGKDKPHCITQVTEHKATLDSMRFLESLGAKVTYLPVDTYGKVRVEDVANAITSETMLISIMHANNEIGTIQPISDIGALAKQQGILFHVDAAQTFGKLPIDVEAWGIDLLSISGHKIYGPKGVGALFIRRSRPRVRLTPLIHGGGHERGMRSGTLSVPSIVGLGMASKLAHQEMLYNQKKIQALQTRLIDGLLQRLDEVYLNGHPTDRLYTNVNISFAYVEGEALMMGLKEIAVSSGSACTSASLEPSYVLKALGIGDELAHSSIRFGLSHTTTEEEIDYTIQRVCETVEKLRDMSPLYEMAKEGINLKEVEWGGANV